MAPIIIAFLTGFSLLSFNPFMSASPQRTEHRLSERQMSLNKRYSNPFVNSVFKNNILLTLSYMENNVDSNKPVDWNSIEKFSHYEFTLRPKDSFAFHDSLLPSYQGKVVKTTNAHFNLEEGFLSDGYLPGDGVCHVASLMNWAARDAKLDVLSPISHNFASIPEIPAFYGVSIYSQKNEEQASEEQNLYITNNLEKPIKFAFDYRNGELTVSVFAID